MTTAVESRGSITYSSGRPPLPLDIFCCPVRPSSYSDELHLTDGISYNYNCRQIPPPALKALIKRPKLVAEAGVTDADVDGGRVLGFVFVSERDDGLETLYIALRFNDVEKVKVFSMAEIFGSDDFIGARLEDSGCFGGGYTLGPRKVDHFIVYISTKEPAKERRTPWTAVYTTNLRTGKTERLTPEGVSDLSPAVSPSGKMVAVASFQTRRWQGEIVKLETDIYIMNVDGGQDLGRKKIITQGGWPSWGSDDVIFFHRGMDLYINTLQASWGVFRHNINTDKTIRVTPETIDAMTPAAICESKVAVVTIRERSSRPWSLDCVVEQYRHIEIFDVAHLDDRPLQITQRIRPKGHHFNPFVLDGGSRIGYHRCKTEMLLPGGQIRKGFQKVESHKDVDLLGMPHLFPTISTDGSKLALVDRERKTVWLADSNGPRVIYEKKHANSLFSVSWNQNPNKDTLYVCVGPSFHMAKPVEIYAIINASKPTTQRRVQRLTAGGFNNAFPSSSPDGNKLVFRSTRYAGDKQKKKKKKKERRTDEDDDKKHKNLYILEDADIGEFGDSDVTRLTNGQWSDTYCQWSPDGDWVAFSSSRDKPNDAPGNGILDEGYYSVFMVKVSDPTVVIRVINSGEDFGGHVLYPVFSADGRSIAVSADLAAVSVEPISLQQIAYALRPYSDIFVVDIDPKDPSKNMEKRGFRRITHSRYDCSTSEWTARATDHSMAHWSMMLQQTDDLVTQHEGPAPRISLTKRCC